MAQRNPDRESYFPAIEKKYGQPMSHWFAQMKSVADQKYPDLELVIAWNQPMLKSGKDYVFGVSVATQHITIAEMGEDLTDEFRDRLADEKLRSVTRAATSRPTVSVSPAVRLCEQGQQRRCE